MIDKLYIYSSVLDPENNLLSMRSTNSNQADYDNFGRPTAMAIA